MAHDSNNITAKSISIMSSICHMWQLGHQRDVKTGSGVMKLKACAMSAGNTRNGAKDGREIWRFLAMMKKICGINEMAELNISKMSVKYSIT